MLSASEQRGPSASCLALGTQRKPRDLGVCVLHSERIAGVDQLAANIVVLLAGLIAFLLPVDPIGIGGLAGLAHYREGPERGVRAEHLLEIVDGAFVVGPDVELRGAVEVVDGGFVAQNQVQMEFEEEGEQDGQQRVKQPGHLQKRQGEEPGARCLARRVGVVERHEGVGCVYKMREHEGGVVVAGELGVDEQEDEVLAIPEANAVVDPRAVVVHVDHAPVAHGAVVAPFRLEQVAHQTVAFALLLAVVHVEAPEGRHLSRVGHHDLHEAPREQDDQYVEKDQHDLRVAAAGQGERPPDHEREAVVLENDDQHCEEHEEIAEDLGLSAGESSWHFEFKLQFQILIMISDFVRDFTNPPYNSAIKQEHSLQQPLQPALDPFSQMYDQISYYYCNVCLRFLCPAHFYQKKGAESLTPQALQKTSPHLNPFKARPLLQLEPALPDLDKETKEQLENGFPLIIREQEKIATNTEFQDKIIAENQVAEKKLTQDTAILMFTIAKYIPWLEPSFLENLSQIMQSEDENEEGDILVFDLLEEICQESAEPKIVIIKAKELVESLKEIGLVAMEQKYFLKNEDYPELAFCEHGEDVPCTPENCPCASFNLFCNDFCLCRGICKRQYPGCKCQGVCDDQCPCVLLQRACTPGLCPSKCFLSPPDVELLPDQRIEQLYYDIEEALDDPQAQFICENAKILYSAQSQLVEIKDGRLVAKESLKTDSFLGEFIGELITEDQGDKAIAFSDTPHTAELLHQKERKAVVDTRELKAESSYAQKVHPAAYSNTAVEVIYANGIFRIFHYTSEAVKAGNILTINRCSDTLS